MYSSSDERMRKAVKWVGMTMRVCCFVCLSVYNDRRCSPPLSPATGGVRKGRQGRGEGLDAKLLSPTLFILFIFHDFSPYSQDLKDPYAAESTHTHTHTHTYEQTSLSLHTHTHAHQHTLV